MSCSPTEPKLGVNSVTCLKNVLTFSLTLLLSAFGYEFLFFILTVHVFEISHKAFAVGIFYAITFFPKIFSPFYGVFVDRYDRKMLLAANAGLTGVVVLTLGMTSNIAMIYLLWFIATIFIMFINNARTALMTEVMPNDNYLWGNSVILSILNLARLSAPLIAAYIMQLTDKKTLLAFSSSVYFLCMVISLFVKLNRPDGELKKFSDTFYYIKEGMEYIVKNRVIKSIGLIGVYWRIFLGMQFSLMVVYVTKWLGKTEVEYGLFMTAIGLGSLAGSVIGPFIAKVFRDKTIILVGLTLHYACFSLLGTVQDYRTALAISFLSFCIFYITIVGIHSVRDTYTRPNIRGRVYGASTSIFTPPTIVSILLCGYLADVYGVEKVFIACGACAVMSVLLIVPRLRVPAPEHVAIVETVE